MLQHPFTGDVERERLLAFVSRDPLSHRHVVDFEYRLCSPSAHIPANTCLWSFPNGDIVGFAIIQRQFWTIDYGTTAAYPEVFASILQWAHGQMEGIANEEQDKYPDGIMNFFDCYEDDYVTQAALLAAGYQEFPSWTQAHRWQSLDYDLTPLELPAGLVLRPLRGKDEAASCAALQRLAFDSTNMTTQWRVRIMQATTYVPDLDLVIAAADGELVAFCLGWQLGDQGQIEPIGVHPDFQRQGLGRILLRHCLQRMRQRGIAIAHIEHDGEPDPAPLLYIAEGFDHPRQVGKYMRRWQATS